MKTSVVALLASFGVASAFVPAAPLARAARGKLFMFNLAFA